MGKILITGCSGTIGRALIGRLINKKTNQLICIDNNEASLFELSSKYENQNIKFIFCDIRDKDKLKQVMNGVDTCFHTAALKHVGLCEESPSDAIKTNIIAIDNLIEASLFNNIKKFIFTSSDKSVNPTNVMGTSKLMGEKLITAANFRENNKNTIFTSVRFGNVIGSSGSVVPIFYNQIINNEKITITDKSMTRFLMGLDDAIDLIMDAYRYADGGEIFISKMPSTNIYNLAISMIEIMNSLYNVNYSKNNIKYIGIRPGEKMYEELINSEEINRTYESKNFFLVFSNIYRKSLKNYKFILKKYKHRELIKSDSKSDLNREQLKKLIIKNFKFK